MEEEQCPCDDCGANCDYWDSNILSLAVWRH